jgi:RNA polymerase sigma factor (sigma-70 family)
VTAMHSHWHASDRAGPDAGSGGHSGVAESAATPPDNGAGPAAAPSPAAVALDPVTADQLVAELYRTHGLAVLRIALLLVGDKPTAEDVVQDAFAGLYRMSHQLSSPDRALAYLRVSVVNGCRSVHRARRVRSRPASQYAPAVWSAEAAVLAKEDSRLMLQAVARLPRRSREVLGLRYYLDLADTEIAEILGVSRGTVSSTASRALAALARQLREKP